MGLECADSCHKIGVALIEAGKSESAVFYLRRCFLILKWFELTSTSRFKINEHYLRRVVTRKLK